MNDQEFADEKERAFRKASAILSEHYSHVVILATTPFPGERTLRLTHHNGDTYACIGMMEVFRGKLVAEMETV